MCTYLSSAYQTLSGLIWSAPSASPPQETEMKTVRAMEQVLEAKKEHVQTALANKWDRYNPIFIFGDVFTIGYLGFQGVQALSPSVQSIAAVGAATLVCGVIAGVINIGVGIVSLKESIQAFRNGDKMLGMRLLLDFICCTAIGVVMILASLAIKVSILGGIGAFFASNPWLLPVLFFIITIPLLLELSCRINHIATSKDLGSQLQLNQLKTLLQQSEPDWDKIENLYEKEGNAFSLKKMDAFEGTEQLGYLSTKMEELQADMGVTAAIEAFTLLRLIKQRKQKEALEQIEIVKTRVDEWNQSLYLRMAQQILYIIGFIVSMAALTPNVNADLLNGTQSFFLVGANVIPLFMDSCWPFKRNTPIVVPKVETSEIKPPASAISGHPRP